MSRTVARQPSPRQLRAALRFVHLALGGVSAVVLYSPTVSDRAARLVLAGVVLPLLTVTGLWIWQQAAVRRSVAVVTGGRRPALRERPSRTAA